MSPTKAWTQTTWSGDERTYHKVTTTPSPLNVVVNKNYNWPYSHHFNQMNIFNWPSWCSKSDQHLTSPYNIAALSHRLLMRMRNYQLRDLNLPDIHVRLNSQIWHWRVHMKTKRFLAFILDATNLFNQSKASVAEFFAVVVFSSISLSTIPWRVLYFSGSLANFSLSFYKKKHYNNNNKISVSGIIWQNKSFVAGSDVGNVEARNVGIYGNKHSTLKKTIWS